jgi:hypothetical protein
MFSMASIPAALAVPAGPAVAATKHTGNKILLFI